MTLITIPKKLAEKGELVVIPRREYEEFLALRKAIGHTKPTSREKRAIVRGRKEVAKKQYKNWNTIRNEMARRSR